MELMPKAAERLFYNEIFAFIIPPCRLTRSYLPLHKGGSLPPDSRPKRCNKRSTNKSFVLLLLFGRVNLFYGRHFFRGVFCFGVGDESSLHFGTGAEMESFVSCGLNFKGIEKLSGFASGITPQKNKKAPEMGGLFCFGVGDGIRTHGLQGHNLAL